MCVLSGVRIWQTTVVRQESWQQSCTQTWRPNFAAVHSWGVWPGGGKHKGGVVTTTRHWCACQCRSRDGCILLCLENPMVHTQGHAHALHARPAPHRHTPRRRAPPPHPTASLQHSPGAVGLPHQVAAVAAALRFPHSRPLVAGASPQYCVLTEGCGAGGRRREGAPAGVTAHSGGEVHVALSASFHEAVTLPATRHRLGCRRRRSSWRTSTCLPAGWTCQPQPATAGRGRPRGRRRATAILHAAAASWCRRRQQQHQRQDAARQRRCGTRPALLDPHPSNNMRMVGGQTKRSLSRTVLCQ